MAKVWINPAFKDKVPNIVKEKETTLVKKEKKGAGKKFADKKKPIIPKPSDPILELKFLQNLMEKQIPIEAKLIDGSQFTGKIKWFSEWSMALESPEKQKEIIFNRLQTIYYSQLKENTLSEKDIENLPEPDIAKVEISFLQQFKDNKTPILFHLKNNVQIKGIIDWYEKLIYHIKSIDGTKEYNIYKNSVIYFEGVPSE